MHSRFEEKLTWFEAGEGGILFGITGVGLATWGERWFDELVMAACWVVLGDGGGWFMLADCGVKADSLVFAVTMLEILFTDGWGTKAGICIPIGLLGILDVVVVVVVVTTVFVVLLCFPF